MKKVLVILLATAVTLWGDSFQLNRLTALDRNNAAVQLGATKNADGSYTLNAIGTGTDSITLNIAVASDNNNQRVRLSGTKNSDGTFSLAITPGVGFAFAADVSANSHKLTSLADGSAAGDAVNKGQLDTKAADAAVVHLNSTAETKTGILTAPIHDNGGQVWSVIAAGAKGDGTTDDGAIVNSLYSTVGNAGGGTIFFPASATPYEIGRAASAIILTKSNVTFAGAGIDRTVLQRTGFTGFMFNTSNTTLASNITFQDMTIDGGVPAKVTDSSANNIFIGPNLTRVTFKNCRFINNPFVALTIAGTHDVTVQDCIFEDPGTGHTTAISLQQGGFNYHFVRNNFRYLYGGIVQASETNIRAYRDIEVTGNTSDGGWYTSPALYTGTTTSGTNGTTLVDSGVTFDLAANRHSEVSSKAGQCARIMNVRASSAGTGVTYSSKQGIHDPSGLFVTNSVQVGDMVRAGTAFAIVSAIDRNNSNGAQQETDLTVEEWLSDSTRLPVAAPTAGTAYTIYNAYIGSITSWSGHNITVSNWVDINGNVQTPGAGLPYEIGYTLPNYQGIIAGTNSIDWRIISNRFFRGNSDQIALNGGAGHLVVGNVVNMGRDTGITVQSARTTVVGNRVRRQGSVGIVVIGNYNNVSSNVCNGNHWLINTANGADIYLSNLGAGTNPETALQWAPSNNLISSNVMYGDGVAIANYGFQAGASSGAVNTANNKVLGNTSSGHVSNEFQFTGTLFSGNDFSDNAGSVSSVPSGNSWHVGALTAAAVPHQWLSAFNASTGAFTLAQPVSTDLSDVSGAVNAASGLMLLDANGKSPASVQRQGSFADASGGTPANTNTTGTQTLDSWTPVTTGVFNTLNRNFHFKAAGVATYNNSATSTFRITLGGVTILSIPAAAVTATQTNAEWQLEGDLAVMSTGSTGTVMCHGLLFHRLVGGGGAPNVFIDSVSAASAQIDLTGTPAFTVNMSFSANGSTPNTCTAQLFSGQVTN